MVQCSGWSVVHHGFVFRLQVPMLGKGVVEAMVKVLAATQGGGVMALQIKRAACLTLKNVAIGADNQVLLRDVATGDAPGDE